ncbi:MAG: phosphate signaling complex protein PhoU [Isosphaeraceae bacterium]|nr:phosphate signaling complex protein PhoU [Isosphaeraceae bacterium]
MGESGGTFSPFDWDADRSTLGRHFVRDMEGLWNQILALAAVVEESLNVSIRALCERRADLARVVKSDEEVVNRSEVAIERECLKILALHQPVASDLRRVAVVLRVNSELERMAELAQHIAKRARKRAKSPLDGEIPEGLENLATQTLGQVRETLDALIKHDGALARVVIRRDREIDRRRARVHEELKEAIRREPDRLDTWLRLINTARNLERVSDHAANIAESVIYLTEGDIVRHSHTDQFREPTAHDGSPDDASDEID